MLKWLCTHTDRLTCCIESRDCSCPNNWHIERTLRDTISSPYGKSPWHNWWPLCLRQCISVGHPILDGTAQIPGKLENKKLGYAIVNNKLHNMISVGRQFIRAVRSLLDMWADGTDVVFKWRNHCVCVCVWLKNHRFASCLHCFAFHNVCPYERRRHVTQHPINWSLEWQGPHRSATLYC